jgi:hypothetical protein
MQDELEPKIKTYKRKKSIDVIEEVLSIEEIVEVDIKKEPPKKVALNFKRLKSIQ